MSVTSRDEENGATITPNSTMKSSQSSSSSTIQSQRDQIVTLDKFILNTRGPLLFTIYGLSTAVFIIAGIVRSCIVLAGVKEKLDVLNTVEKKMAIFQVIEATADLTYKESLARVKYLSTGLNPVYYAEITNVISENDLLFGANSKTFQQFYFRASEFRQYNCSFDRIRSNLASRPNAVPISQHRTLDESHLNPWDDADYFECLLAQLADVQGQELANAFGIDFLWQIAVAYYLSMRSVWNIQVGLNYAFLTRELVLKKGSVFFSREKDADNLDDAVAIAKFLINRADLITTGVNCKPAAAALHQFADQFSAIENATKALIIVLPGDKFEPTAAAKTALNLLIAVKDQFRENMLAKHLAATNDSYRSIASEAVKLFIFAVLLPTLAYRSLVNFTKEAARLKNRYEKSIDRYLDSCKAIFRLLPEPIARKLNIGNMVHPEFFHSATVFYSDIVGFTSICSKLTAIEVLAMLNMIYTTFDSRTNAFKCYKIETIGDAYVVASGVPTRTPGHSAEIASLALVLVEEVGMIKVPNNTSIKVCIRVGVNSGPVIAGIVGIKMLRYCLFGKTVLYANRMEQTSQPQKIQLSHTSYLELEKIGGFIMVPRSKEEWPEKQPTYWLAGRVTNSVPLSLFKAGNNGNVTLTQINLF